MLDTLRTASKVVGLKQSHRAIKAGCALRAYLAADAEEKVSQPFIRACADAGVELIMVESMSLLGDICGVKVGAATVVVLK